MLSHASWVNGKKFKSKIDEYKDKPDDTNTTDPIVYKGKPLSKLNSEELSRYYSDWS